ncbi:MAG: hypothetical protein CVU87_11185 [Firmicutes bacterium HGW-Firmicutes-12]|nr:MAG: hypothetical protein CVU87_11185 [Firmicutes bacterium HGW-Firmicutes-12]
MYAGVYGSFLLHALRPVKRYQLDSRDILVERGGAMSYPKRNK